VLVHRDEVTAIGSDPDALERFYRAHVEAVERFVTRRVDDPHLEG
jgi:RNA polymerase sigma-70 factor (ECF subfamily)